MTTVWALVIGVAPAVLVVLRDVIALCRSRVRRRSIERLARGGFDIVDRDTDGAMIAVSRAEFPHRDEAESGRSLAGPAQPGQ
ncbi:hypothetical protein MOQ72_42875 [Saccharopolyspora sp. K220]|nr:hypothetical protein [Saccharopolyspora soli]